MLSQTKRFIAKSAANIATCIVASSVAESALTTVIQPEDSATENVVAFASLITGVVAAHKARPYTDAAVDTVMDMHDSRKALKQYHSYR